MTDSYFQSGLQVLPASGTSLTLWFGSGEQNVYDVTLSANCTYSIGPTGGGADKKIILIERQPNSGPTFTGTLPGGVIYPNGTPAQTTANGAVRKIEFSTEDSGVTIFGDAGGAGGGGGGGAVSSVNGQTGSVTVTPASIGALATSSIPVSAALLGSTAGRLPQAITPGGGLGLSGTTLGAQVPVTSVVSSGTAEALAFGSSGDVAYDITLSANCSYTIGGGVAGQYQRLTLIERQPASGSVYVGTLPSGVKYSGGSPPPQSTANGQIRVVVFATSDGGVTYLGGN